MATLCKVKEETDLKSDNFYSPDIGEQFYDVDRRTISMFHWSVGFEDGPFAGQHPVLTHVEAEFIQWKPAQHLLINQMSRNSGPLRHKL